MSAVSTRLRVFVVILALGGTAVSGCTKAAPEDQPTPSPSVSVPAGETLTTPGTKLAFGGVATVPFVPNPKRHTVLKLGVTQVRTGSMADFASYQLDPTTEASTPYYVSYTVTNTGSGDVGNLPVPLFAKTSGGKLVQSSSFTNTFAKCPSTPLPASFGPQATTTGCLVFLTAPGSTLTGVVFQPVTNQAAISWQGTVQPVPSPKPKKKAKH